MLMGGGKIRSEWSSASVNNNINNTAFMSVVPNTVPHATTTPTTTTGVAECACSFASRTASDCLCRIAAMCTRAIFALPQAYPLSLSRSLMFSLSFCLRPLRLRAIFQSAKLAHVHASQLR